MCNYACARYRTRFMRFISTFYDDGGVSFTLCAVHVRGCVQMINMMFHRNFSLAYAHTLDFTFFSNFHPHLNRNANAAHEGELSAIQQQQQHDQHTFTAPLLHIYRDLI